MVSASGMDCMLARRGWFGALEKREDDGRL